MKSKGGGSEAHKHTFVTGAPLGHVIHQYLS